MANKNLVLLIVAHQAYIRHIEDEHSYGLENDILFNSISNVYLPLVNMLHRFDLQASVAGKSLKIAMVVSPTLCEMLSDPNIQEQYIEWLDRKIALGEKEIVRCREDESLFKNAKANFEKAVSDKHDFCEVYAQNLVKEISYFEEKGILELLATCGTYAYLPHYFDIPEVLNAQVESGLYAHRRFFNTLPNGFYLPYLGYTNGIEKILRSYGMNYSLVDNHGFFFSKDKVEKGIFAPVKCERFNPLAFFAQDPDTVLELKNYSQNEVYKDISNDIGFELSTSDLSVFLEEGAARIPTGFRYYTKKSAVYDENSAIKQVEIDAKNFVDSKVKKLSDAENLLQDSVSLVCTIPAEILGAEWAEGNIFFEKVVEDIMKNHPEINLTSCSDILKEQKLQKKEIQTISIYPCSDTGNGFAEDLLDSSNAWMIRYARKMSERMIDISDRFPNDTGLKIRLLNLGAKELLLAQSGEWARFIHDDDIDDDDLNFVDYAEKRFIESIKSFIIVYDSLGSNTVSTEWLTRVERQHKLFPWMNFRIFSKKK